MGLTLDEVCNVTEAHLVERMGAEDCERFLTADAEEMVYEAPAHHEVAAPIPEGISPYFPTPEQLVPVSADHAALMGAFSMPVAEEQ